MKTADSSLLVQENVAIQGPAPRPASVRPFSHMSMQLKHVSSQDSIDRDLHEITRLEGVGKAVHVDGYTLPS